jgi:transposase
VPIRLPKDLSDCRAFFLKPASARHRQYEAFRAYFVEERPAREVARAFGYTPGSFAVMCHQFRREPAPEFFVTPKRGPREQPKKSAARVLILELRKRNYSIYDISEALKERQLSLSPTAVAEVLKAEGFAPLPRRRDAERPARPHSSVEPVADVRQFSLAPRHFHTRCGGLFLFVPQLVQLPIEALATAARLPGSKMIPAAHALRACLALKLHSIERKSHIMALCADEGLALFAGLNAIPKRAYLLERPSNITHAQTTQLVASFQEQLSTSDAEALLPGRSFNLDFHSVPYYGEDPQIERHFVSMRSRRQKSILAFLAQDADGHAFCYANADLRKGEEDDEIFNFIAFWEKHHGERPRHLVFDSRLTTHANLARLDKMGITFMTLRRRSAGLLKEVALLSRSAWRTVELDVPSRKYRTPRVFEQTARVAGKDFRQLFIQDLGHEEPTILLTNDRRNSTKQLITRYAQRMLIENALSDAVRFFHIDALSSAVGLKVDFDMALLVIASGLYRLLARRMRGYADSQARTIFRDLIDMPATVDITATGVEVKFDRRAHLPILLASGLFNTPVNVPWWNNLPLRLTA